MSQKIDYVNLITCQNWSQKIYMADNFLILHTVAETKSFAVASKIICENNLLYKVILSKKWKADMKCSKEVPISKIHIMGNGSTHCYKL